MEFAILAVIQPEVCGFSNLLACHVMTYI